MDRWLLEAQRKAFHRAGPPINTEEVNLSADWNPKANAGGETTTTLKSRSRAGPTTHIPDLMISEGKYRDMPLNHKRFPWNSRSPFSRSNFRQNSGEGILVANRGGGGGGGLNKAPILPSTGAGNRTPCLSETWVGNARCGWVFFSLPVALHKAKHTLRPGTKFSLHQARFSS